MYTVLIVAALLLGTMGGGVLVTWRLAAAVAAVNAGDDGMRRLIRAAVEASDND